MTSPAPRRGEAATRDVLAAAVAKAVQDVMDARCLNHPANYGGCTECSPIAEEVTDAVLALPEVAEPRGAARCWGYADVAPDGHVNPGAVHYASNEEAAVRLAEAWDGTPVTRLVTEWVALVSSSATEPESAS